MIPKLKTLLKPSCSKCVLLVYSCRTISWLRSSKHR